MLLRCIAAAFTSTRKPNDFAVLCQLITSCRPRMRFLFIGSQVSPSLPSYGRLPFRSWLQIVVCYDLSYLVFPTGDLHPFYNMPMLGTHKAVSPTNDALSLSLLSLRSCAGFAPALSWATSNVR